MPLRPQEQEPSSTSLQPLGEDIQGSEETRLAASEAAPEAAAAPSLRRDTNGSKPHVQEELHRPKPASKETLHKASPHSLHRTCATLLACFGAET